MYRLSFHLFAELRKRLSHLKFIYKISGCLFWMLFLAFPILGSYLLTYRKEYQKMSYKKKAEQRKEFKEYLSISDKLVLDTKKYGIGLISEDGIFVLVNGTNNYWISNYGRLVNNLRGN